MAYDKRNDAYDYYWKDIKDIPTFDTLSTEEANELVLKAQSGDKKAENDLVEANLRYVIAIVNDRCRKWNIKDRIARNDLIEAGNIGLLNALKGYNRSKGSFIAYASRCIRNAIYDAMKKMQGGETVELDALIDDHWSKSPESQLIGKCTKSQVAEAVKSLPPEEEKVLALLYGLYDNEERSSKEVADILHKRPEQVEHIEYVALEKLRNSRNLRK